MYRKMLIFYVRKRCEVSGQLRTELCCANNAG